MNIQRWLTGVLNNGMHKVVTIVVKSIDKMMNIKVDVPCDFAYKIYKNDTLVHSGTLNDIPDIINTKYIETKLVLEFKTKPSYVKIFYTAVLLYNEDEEKIESEIKYNTDKIPRTNIIVGDHDIGFYRACCCMSRMATYSISDAVEFIESPFVDKCEYCNICIKATYIPIWYINSPKLDFFLCDDCGSVIGEKTDDKDILRSYKLTDWKYFETTQ